MICRTNRAGRISACDNVACVKNASGSTRKIHTRSSFVSGNPSAQVSDVASRADLADLAPLDHPAENGLDSRGTDVGKDLRNLGFRNGREGDEDGRFDAGRLRDAI